MESRFSAFLKSLVGIAFVSSLAACSDTHISSAGSQAISNALGIATDDVCWLSREADAAASITYGDSCQFDRKLRKSLSTSLSEVTVTTGGAFKQDAVPTRLGNWLERVRSSGGAVATCSADDGSMGIITILPVIWQLFGAVRTHALYQPAKNYDAVLISEKGGSLIKVMFAKRASAPSCPAGTTKTTSAA